ncbi:hypothetical protein M3667_11890 [Microbacterium sp. P26]|uniref:hypothetical protein n=1 Tax=Microbacterium TaxID=33882 RepID=UPI00203FC47F|nr:hypothetical protein [Microbacterium sp. P26]MCM3502572.1 hypothetical protein [Microbacterium sp. P26]
MTLRPGIRVVWRAVPPGIDRRTVSRAVLAGLLPSARFVSRCSSCGGEHGRVRVEGEDAAVSVSYAAGWTVVAMTQEHAAIGVDAVAADAQGLARVLPGGGDALSWARVEAVLKADGRGLAVDPARVEVSLTGHGWSARVQEAGAADVVWRGEDVKAPPGIVAAVALGS